MNKDKQRPTTAIGVLGATTSTQTSLISTTATKKYSLMLHHSHLKWVSCCILIFYYLINSNFLKKIGDRITIFGKSLKPEVEWGRSKSEAKTEISDMRNSVIPMSHTSIFRKSEQEFYYLISRGNRGTITAPSKNRNDSWSWYEYSLTNSLYWSDLCLTQQGSPKFLSFNTLYIPNVEAT